MLHLSDISVKMFAGENHTVRIQQGQPQTADS